MFWYIKSCRISIVNRISLAAGGSGQEFAKDDYKHRLKFGSSRSAWPMAIARAEC